MTNRATSQIRSVCLYCGAKAGSDPAWAAAAEALGRGLAERGMELVYGGGRVGLMGIAADAALRAGGKVTGIIPHFLRKAEVGHGAVSRLILVDTMHERKQRMSEIADAFVVLPGGLGTLDEMFEIVTWKQLGLHDKSIVIADIAGFWQPLRDLLDHIVRTELMHGELGDFLRFAPDIERVFALLETAPAPRSPLKSEQI
ncbi:MAG: TIGR00730 family Rossman fold protein [Alphaproteobacteria bacterium]